MPTVSLDIPKGLTAITVDKRDEHAMVRVGANLLITVAGLIMFGLHKDGKWGTPGGLTQAYGHDGKRFIEEPIDAAAREGEEESGGLLKAQAIRPRLKYLDHCMGDVKTVEKVGDKPTVLTLFYTLRPTADEVHDLLDKRVPQKHPDAFVKFELFNFHRFDYEDIADNIPGNTVRKFIRENWTRITATD